MRTVDDGSSGSKPVPDKAVTQLEDVAIRFVGDSGDGMQITGSRFTDTAALFGNDVATFPDFPAEIRAPAGTLAGVSGYQVHFAAEDIFTPGDVVDLLVAFNPAALRANIDDVRSKGMVILNSNSLTKKSLTRAGYTDDPLPELRERYEVVEIPITTLNREALQGLALSAREIDRCKNFFALGLLYWLYHRDLDFTERWLASRFDGDVLEANIRTLRAGHAFGETTELLPTSFVVPATKIEPGPYRNITGNAALAWGIVAAGVQMERPVFLGAYPITPASDVLHEVARHRHFDVKTFQAEDEMAAASAAVGAAFAGHLAISVSSGPGFILKQETLGLAVMVELPLVVVDVQRAGPSTGSPTKTEQGDLLAALYGRHSQSPLPILAPATPGDCFYIMLEAFRLATKYMTPVVVLSDGYLANSAEPWKIPSVETLPRAPVRLAQASDAETFEPYERDPETLARPWAIPGTPGLEHRIGGLTKAPVTGDVVYDPISHAEMVQLRQRKIEGITRDIPPTEVNGPNRGELLVLGWGSTHGVITAAIKGARERGLDVSHAHLRHLNPLPSDLGELLGRFNHILLPELNLGQLSMLLRAKYLIDIEPFTKVAGQPFKVSEVQGRIEQILEGNGK
ncbi:MAG: 2-oxoacid:acceptor oxidoreductase subunit alpha [Myxococcota bacterium]